MKSFFENNFSSAVHAHTRYSRVIHERKQLRGNNRCCGSFLRHVSRMSGVFLLASSPFESSKSRGNHRWRPERRRRRRRRTAIGRSAAGRPPRSRNAPAAAHARAAHNAFCNIWRSGTGTKARASNTNSRFHDFASRLARPQSDPSPTGSVFRTKKHPRSSPFLL